MVVEREVLVVHVLQDVEDEDVRFVLQVEHEVEDELLVVQVEQDVVGGEL